MAKNSLYGALRECAIVSLASLCQLWLLFNGKPAIESELNKLPVLRMVPSTVSDLLASFIIAYFCNHTFRGVAPSTYEEAKSVAEHIGLTLGLVIYVYHIPEALLLYPESFPRIKKFHWANFEYVVARFSLEALVTVAVTCHNKIGIVCSPGWTHSFIGLSLSKFLGYNYGSRLCVSSIVALTGALYRYESQFFVLAGVLYAAATVPRRLTTMKND